jgi:hypothetical protein
MHIGMELCQGVKYTRILNTSVVGGVGGGVVAVYVRANIWVSITGPGCPQQGSYQIFISDWCISLLPARSLFSPLAENGRHDAGHNSPPWLTSSNGCREVNQTPLL